MNWLFPGFLAGGLMVGVPLLLHFLRSKPKQKVRFPTLRFLGASAIRDTRKHRLRRLLTLAMRMLIIGLLVAAFARPFFKKAIQDHRRVMVVAIDNSMSMQAAGRWDTNRKWALAQIGLLDPGDRAGLLLMNPAPTWLVPVTDDLNGVRDTLTQLDPGYETTRYAGALRMAGDALVSNPGSEKTLVWMADEQRLGWLGIPFDQPLPPGVKIKFPEAPAAVTHQAAIASLAWVPEPGKQVIEANVRLYAPDTARRRITVNVAGKNGAMVAQQEVELRRDTDNRIKLTLNIPAGAQADGFRVSLEALVPTEADELPADDAAWIAAAPRTGMPVFFEPGKSGADFLAHALGSTRKLAENALEANPLPAADWPSDSVAIVRDGAAFTGDSLARLDRFAASGGALWIFVDGSEEQQKWLAAHGVKITERPRLPGDDEAWHLRDWDPEHPILKAFANEGLLPLMEIEFYKGFNVAGDNITPVANWPDGAAAIAEWNSGGHRMFLCGFPPERAATDWLVKPSFVPFVHQGVRWLSAVAGARMDLRVGDTITLPSPAGQWQAVDSPRAGQPEQKTVGTARPDAPGLYEFTDANQKKTFYAVNVPSGESDLTPWPDLGQLASLESKEEPKASDVKAAMTISDQAAESQQRIWWWLLAVCCVVMFFELGLSNRTAM